MEGRLDEDLMSGSTPVVKRCDQILNARELEHLPLCERIAFERAVKKGLQELEGLHLDPSGLDFTSLYNYPEGQWDK